MITQSKTHGGLTRDYTVSLLTVINHRHKVVMATLVFAIHRYNPDCGRGNRCIHYQSRRVCGDIRRNSTLSVNSARRATAREANNFRHERHKCATNIQSSLSGRHIDVVIVGAFIGDDIDGYDLLFNSVAREALALARQYRRRLVCPSPKDYSVS